MSGVPTEIYTRIMGRIILLWQLLTAETLVLTVMVSTLLIHPIKCHLVLDPTLQLDPTTTILFRLRWKHEDRKMRPIRPVKRLGAHAKRVGA